MKTFSFLYNITLGTILAIQISACSTEKKSNSKESLFSSYTVEPEFNTLRSIFPAKSIHFLRIKLNNPDKFNDASYIVLNFKIQGGAMDSRTIDITDENGVYIRDGYLDIELSYQDLQFYNDGSVFIYNNNRQSIDDFDFSLPLHRDPVINRISDLYHVNNGSLYIRWVHGAPGITPKQVTYILSNTNGDVLYDGLFTSPEGYTYDLEVQPFTIPSNDTVLFKSTFSYKHYIFQVNYTLPMQGFSYPSGTIRVPEAIHASAEYAGTFSDESILFKGDISTLVKNSLVVEQEKISLTNSVYTWMHPTNSELYIAQTIDYGDQQLSQISKRGDLKQTDFDIDGLHSIEDIHFTENSNRILILHHDATMRDLIITYFDTGLKKELSTHKLSFESIFQSMILSSYESNLRRLTIINKSGGESGIHQITLSSDFSRIIEFKFRGFNQAEPEAMFRTDKYAVSKSGIIYQLITGDQPPLFESIGQLPLDLFFEVSHIKLIDNRLFIFADNHASIDRFTTRIATQAIVEFSVLSNQIVNTRSNHPIYIVDVIKENGLLYQVGIIKTETVNDNKIEKMKPFQSVIKIPLD